MSKLAGPYYTQAEREAKKHELLERGRREQERKKADTGSSTENPLLAEARIVTTSP